MSRILILAGIPRKNGNTDLLVDSFVEGVRDHHDVEIVSVSEYSMILYRSAQAKGSGFSGGWAFPLNFDDADQVSDWADEAMHWMVMTGVINGVNQKELSPKGKAVRAQVATMLMRFSEKVS